MATGTQCYLPNGVQATTYEPCFSTANGAVSACCELSSSVCTDKGYCAGSSGWFYRGGCTDQTWKSAACPALCSTAEFDNTFAVIVPCVLNGASFKYCCMPGLQETDADCCNNSIAFDVGRLNGSALMQAVTTTVTASGSGTTIITSTVTQTTSTGKAGTGTSGKETDHTAALATGVTLGILLLLACAACAFLAIKLKKLQQKPAGSHSSSSKKEHYVKPTSELPGEAKSAVQRHQLP